MAKERRDVKRLAISAKVKVLMRGKEPANLFDAYLLETKDITQKGLFLKTENILPINTNLKMEITLTPKETPIFAEGSVAWIAKKSQKSYYPGIGVEIANIARGQNKRFKDFLKEKFRNYRHAVELQRMYLQLKTMAARLYELEEEHSQAENFRKVIDNAVKEIDRIAHMLDKEVWEIKRL